MKNSNFDSIDKFWHFIDDNTILNVSTGHFPVLIKSLQYKYT